MTHSNRVIGRWLAVALVFGGIAIADDARELTWDDLIPAAAAGGQPGNDSFDPAFSMPALPMGVVEELDGVLVKIPGFVVPLEVSEGGKVSEFLLVPYFGACIHYPPPPANQIVHITAEDPMDLESTWEPIWATGKLQTEFRELGLATAGYSMAADTIEAYEY